MASPLLSRDPLTGPVTSEESSALTGKASAEEEALIADPSFMDYVKDIWGSAGRGLKENILSYPGAPGDVYELARSADVLKEKYLGDNEPARVEQIRDRENPLPTTEELYKDVTAHPYEPTTTPGRWTKEITSLISPRGIMRGLEHLGRDVVVPYFAGKAGETAGAQLGPEEAQLLSAGTGIASGPIYEGGKRAAIGTATPERIGDIRTLQGEGVELTGGQATGGDALQYMEAGPFAGKAEGIARQQAQQYTRAALRRAGIDSDRADPATLTAHQDAFGREYEGLIQANNGIVLDPMLVNELETHGGRFEDLKGESAGAVYKTFSRIIDAAEQNGGVISPEVFQQINGEISAVLRAGRNSPELSALSDTLREFRDSMFASMERNGQPGIAERARDLNNRYRNFKIIEKAMRSTGQDSAQGFITPGNLAGAVKQSESITDWAQSRGDFDDLAKSGYLTKPLPSSGTAGRGIIGGAGAGLAAAGGMLLSGQPLAAAGTAATALATPFASSIPGKLLTTQPVRTRLVNRATGLNPAWMDPLQMPPILNQAVQTKPEEPAPVELTPPAPQQQGALQPLTDDPLDQRRQVAGLPLPDMLAGLAGLRMGRV